MLLVSSKGVSSKGVKLNACEQRNYNPFLLATFSTCSLATLFSRYLVNLSTRQLHFLFPSSTKLISFGPSLCLREVIASFGVFLNVVVADGREIGVHVGQVKERKSANCLLGIEETLHIFGVLAVECDELSGCILHTIGTHSLFV